MKSVSKNKFLTCFRPVVDIDDMLDPEAVVVHRSASRRFACNPVAVKHEAKNSATKSMFSDQKCSKFTQNQVMRQPPKTTLAKNTRAHKKSRYSQNCFGSKRSYSAHTESSSNNGNEKSTARVASFNTNIKEIKGLEIELSWSSSSSGSPASESESLSKSNKGQLQKQKRFHCLGIYMILINLVVTVLWGKNSVIILTSILFCCFFLWNACFRRVKGVAELSNRKFKDQKNSQTKGP